MYTQTHREQSTLSHGTGLIHLVHVICIPKKDWASTLRNDIQNIPHLIKTNIPPHNSKIYIGYTYAWNTYYIDLILGHIKSLNKLHFSSVAQSCPTLCDPMNRSTPGLPVHHQLLEFTHTHIHRISDAIQPFSSSVVPFSSCPQSLPASESFPMSQLFAWGGQSTGVSALASFLPNPRADLLQNGLVGSPCSPRDSQESSPTPQFKSINSSTLSFLHNPTLTSIHDHRKNHSLD